MKDYLPLIVGSLSAVTLVLVALLGAWFARLNEHARWLREQRLEACTEWLGLLDASLLLFERMQRSLDGSRSSSFLGTSDEQGVETRELQLQRSAALNRLLILASPKVCAGATELLNLFNVVMDEDVSLRGAKWGAGMACFTALVRSDLELKYPSCFPLCPFPHRRSRLS